jgi:hypothetical protein
MALEETMSIRNLAWVAAPAHATRQAVKAGAAKLPVFDAAKCLVQGAPIAVSPGQRFTLRLPNLPSGCAWCVFGPLPDAVKSGQSRWASPFLGEGFSKPGKRGHTLTCQAMNPSELPAGTVQPTATLWPLRLTSPTAGSLYGDQPLLTVPVTIGR